MNDSTNIIGTALLATLDSLTAAIDRRYRSQFDIVAYRYELLDGMGFGPKNRYNPAAAHSMVLARSSRRDYIPGYGEVTVFSREIDAEKSLTQARADAKMTLSVWVAKLVAKLGAVDSARCNWNDGHNIELTVTKCGRTVVLRQQIVWKRGPRSGRDFAQFPARIYLDGKFVAEKEFKAAFA